MASVKERRGPPDAGVHVEFEVKKEESEEPRAFLRFVKLLLVDTWPWPSSYRIKITRKPKS